jgi:ABC-type nitrate/sulfonate/bicarbonate transport system substrate-binding protein
MSCFIETICGLLLAIFLFHSSLEAADKIRVGFPDLAAPFVSLALGQKRGFFHEEGLQPEFIRINPAIAFQAVVGGEIDYYTVIFPGVAAAIRGVPVRIVACYVPGATIALIARPEFKSVQELRGQTIGINAFGGALESAARLTVKHFGVDPDKEIKLLATGPMESRFAAMKQGLTAATLGSPPTDLLQNREGTIQLMAEWMKIDREMAAATYESVVKAFSDDLSLPEDGLRLLIEEAKRAAKVDRAVSPSEVADLSALREAQREIGIRTK